MKNILVVILLLACASTQAALIDSGTFFSDTDSGLDWLKLAPTLNRSYNDVSSKLGAGQEFDGWRYAAGSEFEQLLLDVGLVPDSDLIDGSGDPAFTITCASGVNFCGNRRDVGVGVVNGGAAEMTAVSDLLGNLAPIPPVDIALTAGLLSDVDTGNVDPTAHFIATIFMASPIGYVITPFGSSLAPGDTDSLTGSYLVRTSTVPVPAAVWLFGSGLGLLGWMRRKTA